MLAIMSDYLPLELMSDVFSRLPVKSLSRFKSISKGFRSLIEDPDFIKFHLNRSRQSGNNSVLVSVDTSSIQYSNKDTRIQCGDLNSIDIHATELDEITFCPMKQVYDVIGCSVDGLTCLIDMEKITILNISTRQHHTVHYYNECDMNYRFGFGYDSINDGYEVVFLRRTKVSTFSYSYQPKVYSLKTCEWRTFGSFTKPYSFITARKGIFLARSLHGLAIRGNTFYLIAAYDLQTQNLYELDMPCELSQNKEDGTPLSLEISVLGGLLCLTHHDFHKKCSNIWVMKEYNVKESWTKLFSLGIRGDFLFLPLAYSQSHDKILMKNYQNCLYWFDLIKDQLSKSNTAKTCSDIADICPQSLVRLPEGKQRFGMLKRHKDQLEQSKQFYKPSRCMYRKKQRR